MPSRLLLAVCAGTALFAADPAAVVGAGQAPWSNAFTMTLRGAERQFVDHAGKTYLLLRIDDVIAGIGDGQDVAFTGKLRRLPGDKFALYRLDGVAVVPVGEALAGRLDGDNLHVMGSLAGNQGSRIFSVEAVAPAASDAQLLHDRMAGIGEADWDRRIAVANWCQEQAVNAGNADFWNATADSLLAAIVSDLGAKAAERKDLALVGRAVDLALNRLRDPGMAARTCSPVWIREHGGAQAEALARRMRSLGYALYKDEWLPRAQALEREYEDRFAALTWKDAEGYYRLGRWVDDNAEALTRSRERSWRCYQAGFAADPSHPGIARELGVQPQSRTAPDASGSIGQTAVGSGVLEFIDAETGLHVTAPSGWRRGQPDGTTVVWTDPNSDTGLIRVRAIPPPFEHEAQSTVLLDEARQRPGFLEIGSSTEEVPGGRITKFSYSWTEGEQQRFCLIALASAGADAPAAAIEARGLPGDQESLQQAVESCIGTISRQPPAAPAPTQAAP